MGLGISGENNRLPSPHGLAYCDLRPIWLQGSQCLGATATAPVHRSESNDLEGLTPAET